ncbi:amino acid permease [Salinimicrobium terrae]|uniref:amino acid permease n=1 Tax=Salinimicrobium terrae TaxID=470866 RepID=UPI00048BE02B|nr:amino acid permease [Salinimicrobium terrae]
MENKNKKKVSPVKSSGLSTFAGVFTPSILTILGVIMYLRFGWVVGNVGLVGSLIIVTLATSITFLTSLSLAAIATDQQVKIGGAYYMISRSLGIESGGAVGISLYLAQALSVSMYTVGFAESIVQVFPQLNEKIIAVAAILFVAGVALVSAKAASRVQYFILAAIVISLISLIFGSPIESTEIELWGASPENSVPFWVVFAVFFPAVTGIDVGVNMSGDLKDAAKSIPKGTFMAVGAGYVIYMVLPIILATRADASSLIEDPMIMRRIAFWGDAILIGVWGATLSSALGSTMAAPRVLQALARDGVLPPVMARLGKGSGKENLPRMGTIFTLIFTITAVLLGDLNMIAPVLTMFFLTAYGVLNISAGVENILKSPSFRPRFKVHWFFSLLGAAGCISAMILINPLATFIAAIFVSAIFFWLKRRNLERTWGGVGRGILLSLIRSSLMRLGEVADPKNWRPHFLVLSGAPLSRWHLIAMANSFVQGKALMTVATVLTNRNINKKRIIELERHTKEFLSRKGIYSLVRIVPAANPYVGAKTMVDNYGLGTLVPNTVILGDTREESHLPDYCDMINYFFRSQRNVMILDMEADYNANPKEKIDLWWGGLKLNGALMIVMAHMLKRSREWSEADLTIKMVVANESAAIGAEQNLAKMIDKMRSNAGYEVIIAAGKNFPEILAESSQKADLVFLGLKEPDVDYADYYRELQAKTSGLKNKVFLLAGEDVPFEEVLF